MPNVIDPQFGVQISADELRYHTPVSILYGVTPTNKFMPVRISNTGELIVGSIILQASDIQIGAVEIKNHDTDDRVFVSTDNKMRVESRLHDGIGTEITSTLVGPKQGIDVNVIGGGGGLTDADDDDIAPNQPSIPLAINLNYGYDGTTRWERIRQTGGRQHVKADLLNSTDNVLVYGRTLTGSPTNIALPLELDDAVHPGGLATVLSSNLLYSFDTGSGTWLRTNQTAGSLNVDVTGSVLPAGATTEATLSAINTTLDISLSTRASEATLSAINTTLDVSLSTRASEITLSAINTKTPALGQAAMAVSVPVAIASDQSAFPINLQDGSGIALTSTLVASDQALDVNIVAGAGGPQDTDDDAVAGGQSAVLGIGLNYGWDGVDWGRINQTGGSLDVNFANSTFNIVSTLNSTTTPLGVSGIFTGTFEDVLKYGHLTLLIATDAADSIVDGLEIQWSSDGVTVDDTDKFTIGANVDKIYTFGPQSKFFRIKYTNNTVAQTTFTIHTVLKQFNQKSSSHRIGELISGEDDSELVKSVLSAKDINSGLWENIESEDGRLLVDATIVPSATSPVTTIHEAVVKDDAFLVKLLSFNLGAAGVELPIMLIRNPGGSGSTLYIHTLGTNNEVKSQTAKINIYKLPTVTATGTPETVENQLVGSATASVMSAFSSPTISANGSLLYSFATGANQNDLRRNFEFGAALPPGFDYLITGTGSNNNTLVDISFEWAEV